MMKMKLFFWLAFFFSLWTGVSVAFAQVEVTLNAPTEVSVGDVFDVNVNVSAVVDLDTAFFTLSFDDEVIQLLNLQVGTLMEPASLTYNWSRGEVRIVTNHEGVSGVTGQGAIIVCQFQGFKPESFSNIAISNLLLGNNLAEPIPALPVDTIRVDVVGTPPEAVQVNLNAPTEAAEGVIIDVFIETTMVNNLDTIGFTLMYTPTVLQYISAEVGDALPQGTSLTFNVVPGKVHGVMNLPGVDGFNGEGAIVHAQFRVVGLAASQGVLAISDLLLGDIFALPIESVAGAPVNFLVSGEPPNPVTVGVLAPQAVRAGDSFTAYVSVTQVGNLDVASFSLEYDKTVLRVNRVVPGNLTADAHPLANVVDDQVNIVVNKPNFVGISGTGTLAGIEFKAIGGVGSNSTLTLFNVLLGDINGRPIPVQTLAPRLVSLTANAHPSVEVSIESPTQVDENAFFDANIIVSQVDELDTTSFALAFDANVLQATQVLASGLLADASLVENRDIPGQVHVVLNLDSVTGVSGAGVIASIRFQAIGASGTKSSLVLAGVLLGDISADKIPLTIAAPPIVYVGPGTENNPPVANAQSVTAYEDTPVQITLTGNDADNDPLTFNVTSQPANGSLSGTAPNLTYTPNPDFHGSDSFTFTVHDGTVESAPATVDITVNSVTDSPIITVGPAEGEYLTVTTVTFEWIAYPNDPNPENQLFSYRLDDEPYSEFGSYTSHTYTDLPEGLHTFMVRAKEPSDSVASDPAIRHFGVDVTPPETQLVDGPPDGGWINTSSVTFKWIGTDNVSTVEELLFAYRFDDGEFTAFSADTSQTFDNLMEGEQHTFVVKAKDKAGHEDPTPLTINFTVDLVPPDTTITAGPAEGELLGSSEVTFEWTGSDDRTPVGQLQYAYKMDSDPFSAFSSDISHTFTGLSDSAHTFSVKASDLAANEDATPATRPFTTDTTPPATSFTAGPGENEHISVTTATFEWEGTDNITTPLDLLFSYRLDLEPYSDFSSDTTHTLTDLSEGTHTFEVRAKDEAGNIETTAVRHFAVDLTPPETLLVSGPPDGGWGSDSVTFVWTGTDNVSVVQELLFAYKFDSGEFTDFAPVTSQTFINLAEGEQHTLVVKAKDKAEHEDPTPLTTTFTVDTTPPDTIITTGPDEGALIASRSVTFEWTGSDVQTAVEELQFAYNLDINPFSAFGPETSHTLTGLVDGFHTFNVKSRDLAGNEDPTPLTINFTVAFVDLQPTAISAPYGPGDVWSGQPIEVTWTVINNGISTVSGSWMDKVYLSDDDQIGSDTLLGEFEHTEDLAGGSSYSNTQSVTLPSDISGDYWIVVETDSRNNVYEENAEVNNILVDDAAIHVNFTPPPDLQVTNVTPSGEALSGRQIYVDWTVANNGIGNASGSWQDKVYLSEDDQLGSDALLGQFPHDGGLNAGESYTYSRPVTLPHGIQGDYWIIVETDCNNDVYEHDAENNNVRVSDASISVQMVPYPDLQVTSVDAPAEAWSGQNFSVSWTITNSGTGATDTPYWYDSVYLSVDAILDGSDTYLGRATNASYLNATESYVQTAEFTLPREIAGPFYLIVKTDSYNNVSEYNVTSDAESNNLGYSGSTMQIHLSPVADLQVNSVNAPATGWSGQQISVTWEVKNAGTARTEGAAWYDTFYLSQDEQLSTQEDYRLGNFYHEGALDEDETYTRTESVTLPVDRWGNYYVFALTDSDNRVYEQFWENNNSAHDTEPVDITLSPPSDLEVSWVYAPAQCSAGNQVTVEWKVINNGGGATNAASWYDSVYLSDNETLETDTDTLLRRFSHSGVLDAGTEYTQSKAVTLSKGIQGAYYLMVWTDSENAVFEYNGEDNNTRNTSTQILIADLEISLVNAPAQCSSGSQITVDWTVANNGAGTTDVSSWYDSVYLSDNETLETGTDTLLGDFQRSGVLTAGANYVQSNTVKLPNGIEGAYYLIVWTDSENAVFESEENNNTRSTSSAVQVTLNLADLQVTAVNPPQSAVAGQSMFVQWMVTNAGTDGTGTAQWQDSLYLSVDQSLQTDSDINLGPFPHDGALASGATYTNSATVTVPPNTDTGTYYLLVKTDINNDVDEYNAEDNNVGSSEAAVQVSASPTPDLQVTNVDAPETGDAGRNISISWTVTNTGGGPNEVANWIDEVYLSLDENLDDPDTRLGSFTHYGSLPAGGDYTRTESMKLPQAISGASYILVKTDTSNSEQESDEDNNVNHDATPVQVDFAPSDLQVTSVDVPATGWAGQPITVNWTVSNEGTGETDASGWYDNLYFSKDTVLDNTDQKVGYRWHSGRLSPGGSYTQSQQVSIPSGVSGPGYIMVLTDSNNHVYEHNNEDNNVGRSDAIQVSLTPLADLVVSQINVPPSGSPGQLSLISWTVPNQGAFDAVGRWYDSIYLSSDDTWGIYDAFVGSVEHNGTVGSGQDYTGNINTALPGVIPGDYYVIVRTDIRNHVRESDEDNNIGASANQISIGIMELTLGVPYQSQLTTGTEHYYKVTVPEGEDLLITLDSDSIFSANELYVRYGAMPSIGQYDFLYDEPFEADQQITVPSTYAGDYYILVRGDYVPDAPAAYTIKAELLLFAIRYVKPDHGGNVGNVTVEITGARFQENALARLISHLGAVINATAVYFNNSSSLFATFDLVGRDSGVYNVQLETPGEGISTLTDGFEVTDGGGAQIFASLIAPQSVRANSEFIVWLDYENIGDTDMTAPLFIVRSKNALLQVYRDLGALSDEVLLLGISSGIIPGVLSPGARNRIPLFSRSGGPGTIEFEVMAITPDVDVAVDWASLQSSTRPDWADPLAWSEFWTNFPERLGSTWKEILGVIADDVNLWSSEGTREYAFDFFYAAQALDTLEDIANPPEIQSFRAKLMRGQQSKRSWRDVIYDITTTTLPYALPPLISELTTIALAGPEFAIDLMITVCHLKRTKILIETGDPEDPRYWALTDTIQRLDAIKKGTYKPPPPDTEGGEQTHDRKETRSVGSFDPNEKRGPAGFGEEAFISAGVSKSYTIYFENVPDATAPAMQVSITDPLDPDLDWRSFRLGEIAFGDTVITVPENRSVHQTRLTLESGMFLDISAGVDITTGEASWLFRTIDPATGEPPIDPSLGFLPPNDENHIGEGHVTFTIKPKTGLTDGTEITNKATIVFDTNEAIDTNEVTNTIQNILPDLVALSVEMESENPMLIEGDELTITATIKNNSEVNADGFNVRFFDGDPDAGGTQIGQAQAISSLNAQDTQTVQIIWDTTRLSDERYVYVKIDPEGAVLEVNEQNNTSSASLILNPRSFTVNFAQDVNMFALPLEPETPYTARSLATVLAANMMVRYKTETGQFEAFIPDFQETDGFPIEGSRSYIAIVDEAKSVTFEGISHLSTVVVEPDINMLSLPLQPETPYTARSFSDLLAANLIVRYNNAKGRFEPFIPDFHTGNGFQIKGGKGYIVFATEGKSVMFTGKGWLDGAQPPAPLLALNNAQSKTSSVFGVAGYIYNDDGKTPVSKTYEVTITNKRTDAHISATVDATNGQYTGTFIDIFDQHPTSSGDKLEIVIKDSKDKIVGGPVIYIIAPDDIKNRYAKLNISLVKQIPRNNMLRQNFPNPFNPETWVPYQLSKDANVTIKIYNVAGQLVRTLELGQQPAGYYMEKEKAAHWNGRNDTGERASSGIYFYTIKAGKFTATKKMILLK